MAMSASPFVPETALEIRARNQATKPEHMPGVVGLLLGDQLRDGFDPPDYTAPFGTFPSAPQ